MAKKEETVFVENTPRPNGEVAAPVEDTVGAATELVGSLVQRTLAGLNNVSIEKTKLVARVIDLGEVAFASAIKLARDANDSEAATERQVLSTVERLVSGWLRWGGHSAQAVASVATLRTTPASPKAPESRALA